MKSFQYLCILLLFSVPAIAQPISFTDEYDKLYDEPIDTVSGKWKRIYRGNDTVFYATKTAVGTTLHVVQIGQSNWYSTTKAPKRWSVRKSSDAGVTWETVWEDTTIRNSGEFLRLDDVFYPSVSSTLITGAISRFIKLDSLSNPIFEDKPFILRSHSGTKSWILDTTFFSKRFSANEGLYMTRHQQANQGLLLTMTVTPTDTIPKLYRWNYYYAGTQLIDTLYPVPFPDFLKGKTIIEMRGGEVGPSSVFLFSGPNALDDPASDPSGAYTNDRGTTWQPMTKRCFDVENKVTLIDNLISEEALFLGGSEVFYRDDRGAILSEEVLWKSLDGGISKVELWRKRRGPFGGISHIAFADERRGMFVVRRPRNYGDSVIMNANGDLDTIGYFGSEAMIYRTEDGGTTWIREPLERQYHVQSPVSDMASGISQIFYLRTSNGSRLRLMTNSRDIFSFEPIATSSVYDENGQKHIELTISHNPASSTCIVDYRVMDNSTEQIQFRLYNTIGSLVFSALGDGITEGNMHIPLDALSNGVYFLRVSYGKHIVWQKFTVAK